MNVVLGGVFDGYVCERECVHNMCLCVYVFYVDDGE